MSLLNLQQRHKIIAFGLYLLLVTIFIANDVYGQTLSQSEDSRKTRARHFVTSSDLTINPYPDRLTVVNELLYFIARDEHGYELWKSDGSIVGTHLVYDVNPGTSD
ncbi:MAG: hypothetical protein AAF614_43905, partial [Chloroflexota bacterium]